LLHESRRREIHCADHFGTGDFKEVAVRVRFGDVDTSWSCVAHLERMGLRSVRRLSSW